MRRLSLFGLVSLLAFHAAAQAPAPSQSEMALAGRLFQEGLTHAHAGEWEPARARFERSYAIAAVPVTLLNLAGAQVQLGLLVAGRESYRNFLSSAEAGGRAARYRAQAEQAIASLEPRIARLTLRVEGLREGDELRVAGVALNRAALGGDLPVDPGETRVEVLREGAVVTSETFELAEGQSRLVTLLVHVGAPTPTEAARASMGDDEGEPAVAVIPSDGEDSGGSSIVRSPWLWAGVGVGVVGAVVAGVLIASSGGGSPYQGNLGSGGVTFQ